MAPAPPSPPAAESIPEPAGPARFEAESEEDEVKPEPEIQEEEFEKVLEGLDVQDKMMGDA
jgi:hypothetical protein